MALRLYCPSCFAEIRNDSGICPACGVTLGGLETDVTRRLDSEPLSGEVPEPDRCDNADTKAEE